MPSVLSVPRPQKRSFILLLDGTWCERTPAKGTVIGQLDRMTVKDPYQIKRYVKGIGVSHVKVEKYIGGGTGHGIKAKVYDIYVDLVSNYNEETDKLCIIGFSRGAFIAIVVASLLDLAGIPKGQDDEVTLDLFNKFWNNELENPAVSRAMKEKYNCIDVPVNFLGCFEAVGALGVPHTGILKVLDVTPRCVRSLEFNNTILPSNVFVFRHALALHEHREPFTPTLMHIPIADNRDMLQVWFTGSHHNLGSNLPRGTGLVNIALSWMISEMLAVGVPIRFNAQALGQHFPHLVNAAAPPANNHTAEIHSTWTLTYKATGYKTRVPGSFGLAGLKTNERIHHSVRRRVTESNPVILGHYIEEGPEGFVWKKKDGSFKKDGTWVDDKKGWAYRKASMDRTDIKEAEVGIDEAHLLGWD
ncbi:hypothetical protein B0O99DRAFT_348494 [Bisporella sp. PMI_857]|nr:hypothetical protein B0O99DRAFT_348494 [Bisporella sp. PMI_857]